MSQIKLSVEQYPVLKADTQFTALFTELEGSENRIRVAIKDYNDALTPYNVRVRSLPRGRLFGAIFGTTAKDRIEPTAAGFKDVPDVNKLLQ
jgi:LemA protein